MSSSLPGCALPTQCPKCGHLFLPDTRDAPKTNKRNDRTSFSSRAPGMRVIPIHSVNPNERFQSQPVPAKHGGCNAPPNRKDTVLPPSFRQSSQEIKNDTPRAPNTLALEQSLDPEYKRLRLSIGIPSFRDISSNHTNLSPQSAPVRQQESPLLDHIGTSWRSGSKLYNHQNKPYTCYWPNCKSVFLRGHDYKRHLRIHTGEKTFRCKTCGKGFSRRDALMRHQGAPIPGKAGELGCRRVFGRRAKVLMISSERELERKNETEIDDQVSEGDDDQQSDTRSQRRTTSAQSFNDRAET